MGRNGSSQVHAHAPAQVVAPLDTQGEPCPECLTEFNTAGRRPLQEACGHIKCRACFVLEDEDCPQCVIQNNMVEKPFSCTKCPKSFIFKRTLVRHLKNHFTVRLLTCKRCKIEFSCLKDLHRHMLIHPGERPYRCWICKKAFRGKDLLDKHIKNAHDQPEEVPCDQAAKADPVKLFSE